MAEAIECFIKCKVLPRIRISLIGLSGREKFNSKGGPYDT